ncbi:phosphatidylinositol N-acetylglucosaminyltransferase subunit C [Hermetia illucens]|uniref:phosphatidylinositol N-acetylglucosaminyltransferase subunit C n=1 Tax=Hermetia illucens TaxID=343691 RepID=UPI0018CC4537|nr:phosphatidylinositol N-acetylglucosaminyltransferase subunit C [Hermetia illucens]
MTHERQWRKNLYEQHDFGDNYTDPSLFLKDLQKNKNVKIFTFKEAVRGATRLTNQISCICAFLIVFYYMYTENVTPTKFLLATSLTVLIGYFLYTGRNFRLNVLLEDSKTLLTVLVFGYMLSPLLHTLTDAISTDTIFSMTFFVMFLHLIYFDYGLKAAIVSKAISLNAAIFGSVCLASRLASSYHAFVLLVVSAGFFVLFPIFTNKFWNPIMIIPLVSICSFCLYHISIPVVTTYVVILIFVNLVCPYIFVVKQKHKNNINGPWDEAIVKETNCDLIN